MWEQYERNWRRAFWLKWKISKLFSEMLYRNMDDEALDRFVGALKTLSPDEVFALVFDYEYKVILRHPSVVAEIARRTPALVREMASDARAALRAGEANSPFSAVPHYLYPGGLIGGSVGSAISARCRCHELTQTIYAASCWRHTKPAEGR